MATMTSTDTTTGAAQLREITDQIAKVEADLTRLRTERRQIAQRWYDRGMTVRQMAEACGMTTEWGVRRLVQTSRSQARPAKRTRKR